MNDLEIQGLSVDAEGVTDQAVMSKLAIAAILIAVIGLLAPVEPRLAFASIIAAVLGLFCLYLAPRANYSTLAKTIAGIAVVVGSMTAVWGIVVRQSEINRINSRAKEVASDYINALSKGEMLTTIQMGGLDVMVPRDDDSDESISKSQMAVKIFMESYAVQQILKRGTAAQWNSGSIVSHTFKYGTHEFRVRFMDENRDNPLPFDVTLQYRPPYKYAPDQSYQWIVELIEQPPA